MLTQKTYFDVFAGIGLVDYALDQNDWKLEAAIDYDLKKKIIYANQFPEQTNKYWLKDVYKLEAADLPNAYLGHASFPCTDVSEAGRRKGVQEGEQSSAIDSLIGLLYAKDQSERPKILLTENVKGLLSSNKGRDIRYLLQHYNKLGYSNDIMIVDAKHFVPQSRKRVFIISFQKGIVPAPLIQDKLSESWNRPRIVLDTIQKNLDLDWTFLIDKPEPKMPQTLGDIVDAKDHNYWEPDRIEYLISQMHQSHQDWIFEKIKDDKYHYATAFRRMRVREGVKQSTAEIRTDGLAGCLRTAKGGSAKQILIKAGKNELKVRLLNEVECARLMGAPDYQISNDISQNDYLFAFGDGVCSSVIEWIDRNYLTPIFEANLSPIYDSKLKSATNNSHNLLSMTDHSKIRDFFEKWCSEHIDPNLSLPIKGRLYGALIVLLNLKEADPDSEWSFRNTLKVNSTDKGSHFGDRSIKNHTSHRLSLALNTLGRPELKPSSGGEAGRTSTGTKRAGLGIIEIVNSFTSQCEEGDIEKIGIEVVDQLNKLVIEKLDEHVELGGIEVGFSQTETIGSFISKIINYKTTKPGAVLQHLVGAKLELRYKNNPEVRVMHHKSSTADTQTSRLGDFDIGNSVIHVTKSPTQDHFRKAYNNAKAGRTTYILIPEDRMGMIDSTKDIDEHYVNKVNVYSIEQFISQNIDEMSWFQKEISLETLKEVLTLYNRLIDTYENDNSLKIIIPDFGI